MSLEDYLDVAAAVIIDDIPSEHRDKFRRLLSSRTITEYDDVLQSIERDNVSAQNQNGPQVRGTSPRKVDNRKTLIPMMDDDDWFKGDPAAEGRREKLVQKRLDKPAEPTSPEPQGSTVSTDADWLI